RRGGAAELAGRVREVHRRKYRQMDQGDQVRGHQAAVIDARSIMSRRAEQRATRTAVDFWAQPVRPWTGSGSRTKKRVSVAAVSRFRRHWIPSSTRLSEWVLTISDRRHGHAEQVCRGDPSLFESDDDRRS